MLSKTFYRKNGSWTSALDRRLQCLVLAVATATCWSYCWLEQSLALAQTPPIYDSTASSMPQPIYWRQSLFQIPYQWGSAAEPGAAIVVRLFASKDQGGSWQQITEAKPNVTSFSYRAEGEGDYWFAVRTLDRNGNSWPAGPLRPELRVIVDTTMPQIIGLRALQRPDGTIDIEWSGQDMHLDPSTWVIEVQREPNGPWSPVPTTNANVGPVAQTLPASSTNSGRLAYQPPIGAAPYAVRARVQDRAGNAATFVTRIEAASAGATSPSAVSNVEMQRLPVPALPVAASSGLTVNNPFAASPRPMPLAGIPIDTSSGNVSANTSDFPAGTTSGGWAGSNAGAASTGNSVVQPQDQHWPADTISRVPLRLWHGTGRGAASDSVTAYGNPTGIVSPTIAGGSANRSTSDAASPSIPADYAVVGGPHFADNQSPASVDQSAIQRLSPYRHAAVERLPDANLNPPDTGTATSATTQHHRGPFPNASELARQLPPGVQPKMVGSRTFALEYEVEEAGWQGISAVELWGTNDSGQSWRMYTRDDDNRTPLIVTVDGEGLYGFRIVVAGAGGEAPVRPVAGDQPELWVGVDLHRPVAELTSVEVGADNLADHMMLRWRAVDDNLDARPISLFYSSRSAGPWSSIATNLENTGEYSWRVERHVPSRFFLRLEARDAAGNIAAYETRDPIEFAPPVPNAQLRSAAPVNPAAAGAAYR